MGWWNNHRLRQAGKYQKRSYKLERKEAERQKVMALAPNAPLVVRVAIEAPIPPPTPPRPDL